MLFSATNDNKRARFSSSVTFASDDAGGKRTLEGLAVVYGPLSDDRGGYKVRIAAGAAEYTPDVLALLNHNSDLLIGNTANQTLTFSDMPEGIFVRIVLPDNVDGDKAWTWVKDRYANGMSFGCVPLDWTDSVEDGQNVRTYTRMLVDEFTITHSPAFLDTDIDVADSKETAETQETEAPADVSVEPEPNDYGSVELAYYRRRLLKIR